MQELHIERTSARGLVGNIYLGRVAASCRACSAAFVDIGLERAAFLHVADIWEHRQNGDGSPSARSSDCSHDGQELIVQVIKDPIGTKGARLSTQVSAGRAPAGLPAAGVPHRHLAAHRGRGRARPLREPPAAPAARGRRAAASSSARWPRPRREREMRPTSSTCASCGATSTSAARSAGARRSSTRTSTSRSACCATWPPRRRRASWSTRARPTRSWPSLRRRSTRRRSPSASSTTRASGRCSTSTASRTRSSARWRGAWTSSPAAT